MTTSNSISACMFRCRDCDHLFAVRTPSEDKQIINRFVLCNRNTRPTCERCGSVDVKRLGEKTILLPVEKDSPPTA